MLGAVGVSHPIDNVFPTSYNHFMDSLDQQAPVEEERDTSRLIIMAAVVLVFGLGIVAAFLFRQPPKAVKQPSPYLAKIQLDHLKMSAAENFIGATVTYVDGDITNSSDKTVTRVLVQVNFEDSMGQLAQREDLPLRIVRTNGAYLEPVDLSAAPLAPGQTQPFRLTFDAISAQWNHQYPAISITDVSVK